MEIESNKMATNQTVAKLKFSGIFSKKEGELKTT